MVKIFELDKIKLLNYIFLILLGFYFCFICLYSLDTIDSGFILSFIGRLNQGQIAYKDFDLVRPAGNVIFWDILLYFFPKNSPYLLIYCRFLVILECVVISFILSKIIFKKTYTYSIIALITLFILHSFNIMPWHTIDGILWGSITILCLKNRFLLCAIIFAFLASCSKQSFYIFTFLSFILIFYDLIIQRVKLKKNDIMIFITFAIIILMIAIRYNIIENIELIISQTKTKNGLQQLYNAGVKLYFFDSKYYNIAFLTLSVFILLNKKISNTHLFYFSTFLIVIFYAYPIFNNAIYKYSHLLFLFFFTCYLRMERKDLFGFLLFTLAWCSSLSWGYHEPTFFIGILYLYLFGHLFTKNLILLLAYIILFSMFTLRILYPYFNVNFFKTNYVFSKDIPIISGIYLSKETNDYCKEAYNLRKKYKKVVYLPGSPLLDVISNTYNNRASWEMDVEYPNFEKDIKNMIKSNSVYYIIDKKPAISINHAYFKSTFTSKVIENKTKVDSTNYFYIYK